ncbi:MAG: hypothetical protein Q9192_006791 [Flavoplaca navasiana]
MLHSTSLAQVEVPKDFVIYPRFNLLPGPPPESFLYNTIVTLKDVALGDYNGIMPIQSTSTRRYPVPVIQFYGVGAGSVLFRRYLIWGLVLSIYNMLFTSTFRNSLVALYYRDAEVGGILFGPPETGNTLLRHHTTKGAISILPQSLPRSKAAHNSSKSSNNSSAPAAPLTANRITVVISPFGSPISANDIYMTIISALSEAAVPPSTDRIDEPFTSRFDTFPCYLVTRPIMPPRRTPPIYEWRHLIQALPQAMEFMVGRGAFRESSMEIKVDGVTVGLATFFAQESLRGLRME